MYHSAANKFQEIAAFFEDPAAVLDDLTRAYSEPHRRYHTLDHILEMLECLDLCAELASGTAAISLAIWFHDVIYDVKASPGANEAASAELLERVAEGAAVGPAAALIRHSAHHGQSDDRDTQLFCDLDLYRLGVPHEAFVRHGEDIRFEYGYLSEADWQMGRSGFLQQILARPVIFQSDYWHNRCEAQARTNIAAAIKILSA